MFNRFGAKLSQIECSLSELSHTHSNPNARPPTQVDQFKEAGSSNFYEGDSLKSIAQELGSDESISIMNSTMNPKLKWGGVPSQNNNWVMESSGKIDSIRGDNMALNSSNNSFMKPGTKEFRGAKYVRPEENKIEQFDVEEVPSIFEESIRLAASSVSSSGNTQVESIANTFNDTVLS
jgi:hypothetical protein